MAPRQPHHLIPGAHIFEEKPPCRLFGLNYVFSSAFGATHAAPRVWLFGDSPFLEHHNTLPSGSQRFS